MKNVVLRQISRILLVVGVALSMVPDTATANPNAGKPKAAVPQAEPRDGQRDFDWAIGRWKMKLRRLKKPLSGSTEWNEFVGTTRAIPFWDGKGQLEEFNVDSPVVGRIDGITVRLYSPTSRQWSLNWANQKKGSFDVPTVGEFKDGRGEFFDMEIYEGRQILVRYLWSNITPTSAHFEQSFSTDGGKTWEVNWITDQTRIE